MSTAKLEHLTSDLESLSIDEQWVIFERLARRLRQRTTQSHASFDAELEDMANDPDIRREIRAIESEFAPALLDGLRETE